MFGLRCAGQKGARGPAQLAKGELLKGSGKAGGRDSKSTNAGQAPEPSRNERRCFNEVVKDLPLVFLNPTVVAAQDNRTAASGCLTIESARAVSELEWKPICMPSAFEHWSDAFDGPHDTGTTGRNRHALRNRESAGVERAGTQKRRTRVGLRDLLDPGAQHVASLFAGTEEQIRTVADRDVPNLGASSEYHGFSFWNGTQNTLDPIRERCGLCLRSRQPGKLSLRAM